jgi:hypothetical protein
MYFTMQVGGAICVLDCLNVQEIAQSTVRMPVVLLSPSHTSGLD